LHGTQYEHMISEYAEFVATGRAKLSREPRVHADDIDNLRRQLSSSSVSHYILCAHMLLTNKFFLKKTFAVVISCFKPCHMLIKGTCVLFL